MSSAKESVAHSSVWTFRCQVLRVLSLLYLLKTSWDQDSLNIKCCLLLCYTTTLYFTNFVFYVLKHFFLIVPFISSICWTCQTTGQLHPAFTWYLQQSMWIVCVFYAGKLLPSGQVELYCLVSFSSSYSATLVYTQSIFALHLLCLIPYSYVHFLSYFLSYTVPLSLLCSWLFPLWTTYVFLEWTFSSFSKVIK